MNVDQLAPDEPLSPELVLVLPPELRAQALARLGAPVWSSPRLRPSEPTPPVAQPVTGTLGRMVVTRLVQLGLIFAAVTIITLVMSVVAHAIR